MDVMKDHLRRWGWIWLMVGIFLASWTGQFVTMMIQAGNEAAQHGEPFSMSDFWPEFWSSTLENWQSEFLQLAFQSILIASVFQKIGFQADHSADKDDVDRLEAKIDKLLDR